MVDLKQFDDLKEVVQLLALYKCGCEFALVAVQSGLNQEGDYDVSVIPGKKRLYINFHQTKEGNGSIRFTYMSKK